MTVSTYRPPESLRAVHAGVGAVGEMLGAELAAQQVKRPLIVCGANIAASPLLERVKSAAEMDCAVFAGSLPHTPYATIDAGARMAAEVKPDAVITLGGSSTSDCAKGIVVLHRTGKASVRELEPIDFANVLAPTTARDDAPTPLICIPTTLSAAEFQNFFGALDERTSRKHPYSTLGLTTRTVILDGEMAATTPAALWAETGVKALDDTLGRYCNSIHDEPAADAVHEAAIRGLLENLGPSMAGDADLRQKVLVDTWLTAFEMPRHQTRTRGPWFSTTARHVLGAVLHLPHGIGSCVALIEALRFHADSTGKRQRQLAERTGLALDAHGSLADAVAQWLDTLGVPARLSVLGYDKTALNEIANEIVKEAPGLGALERVREACERMW